MRKSVLAAALIAAMVVVADAAKIKIEAKPDPSFDFSKIKTWAWDADAGDVIMGLTPTDDPKALEARVEPMVLKYVKAALVRKGLLFEPLGTPDMQLHYYLLATVGSSDQTMGQFLPAVPYWGLPGYTPATSALEVFTKGSLVLDALLPGKEGERRVIWRGVAQSTVEYTDTMDVRDKRIRDASDELIKRFPLEKKKK